MLNLDFTEEQDMLREMVRGLLGQYASNEQIRALEDDPVGYSTDLWAQLAELDLLGLLLPEEYGGSEMSMLEGVIVYEELGRALAPTPHLVSCVAVRRSARARRLRRAAQRVAAGIATGEAILTPAWLEPENGFGPAGVQVRAEADGDGFTISGTKQHVYFAAAADRLVVLARTGDAEDAVDLFLVDPDRRRRHAHPEDVDQLRHAVPRRPRRRARHRRPTASAVPAPAGRPGSA